MMRQNLLTQEKFNMRERERERERRRRRRRRRRKRKIHVKTKTYLRMACIHEMELLTHLAGL